LTTGLGVETDVSDHERPRTMVGLLPWSPHAGPVVVTRVIVQAREDPEAVAGAEIVAELETVTAVIVVPGCRFGPVITAPISPLVKWALADVIVEEFDADTPSLMLRLMPVLAASEAK
jgi:hypothetical protein